MSTAAARAHVAVISAIEADLASGQLQVGSRLLGERALAAELGVGRSSVREAIRVLEAMGVIRTSAGSGDQAGAIVIGEPATGLTSALRLHLASSQLPVADIVATRVLLETWAARQNAVQAAAADIAALTQLLDEMDDLHDPVDFQAHDAQFHVYMAQIAGNAVVSAMMSALRASITGYVLNALPELADWPAAMRVLQRQHRGIVRAVERRDADAAERLVRRHIEGFHRRTSRTAAIRASEADPG